MSTQQEMPEVKYYINLKELQRPEEILGVYTYSPPEGLTKLGFNVVLPSATYEFVSGKEASKYNITLSARNRIYIICKVFNDTYSVIGIGWNDTATLNGFEVSKAEFVRSVKTDSGWLTSRSDVWLVRGRS